MPHYIIVLNLYYQYWLLLLCNCAPVFKNSNFLDIDECKENGRICLKGRCENTPGSYKCVCQDGFIPSPDGDICLGNVHVY